MEEANIVYSYNKTIFLRELYLKVKGCEIVLYKAEGKNDPEA